MPRSSRPAVVLVHWNDDEWSDLARDLESAGFRVVRYEDATGLKQRDPPGSRPAAVVISLRRLPSHGREVADAIWHPKWAREAIRIVFVDGKDDAVAATRARFPAAEHCTWEALPALLAG